MLTILDSNESCNHVHVYVVLPNFCDNVFFFNGCVHHLVKVWLCLYDVMHVSLTASLEAWLRKKMR